MPEFVQKITNLGMELLLSKRKIKISLNANELPSCCVIDQVTYLEGQL